MSNLKISQLPSFTGNTSGSWLVMNNSGETTTYKVQRETLLSGFQPSGNYATTGSNVFRGNQTITGSVNITGSINLKGNTLTIKTEENYLDGIVISGSNGSVGISTFEAGMYIEDLPIGRSGNGITFMSNKGIQLRTYGSNVLIENQGTGSIDIINSTIQMSGSVDITGSLKVSGSSTLNAGGAGNNILTGSINAMDAVGPGNYMVARAGGSNFLEAELNQLSGSIRNRIIGPTQITGSLNVTSGATISGSIIQTGSLQGNVLPLSISSNTASLNLNNGNYFTLQLVSGSATHLNPSNIKPGQTVSVFVNTTGSATMTFPSSIKQISGSAYTPSTGTRLDILTLISNDSSTLYLVNAKNFV